MLDIAASCMLLRYCINLSHSRASLQAEAERARSEASQRFDDLAGAYGELKTAWDNRGPRDEDVAIMAELRGALAAREAQLATAEQRFHELRNVR